MRKTLLLICGCLTLQCAIAQPATEIVVFDLTSRDGNLFAIDGVNISAHPGYDNQPFFHPDKDVLYYTSADDAGRTDIMQYDFMSHHAVAFTKTAEREYSPTVTPDKQFISCIIQRDNGTQDLGKYPISGGPAIVIIDNLTVGYHVWLNDQRLFLFVLGEPATLRSYDVTSKSDAIVSTNIGRSLHHLPHRNAVSFVQKTSDNRWLINEVNGENKVAGIGHTMPGREDLTWLPDGRILMSDGKSVFVLAPGKSAWSEVKLTSTFPLKNITRMAVNAKGTKLALVTEE